MKYMRCTLSINSTEFLMEDQHLQDKGSTISKKINTTTLSSGLIHHLNLRLNGILIVSFVFNMNVAAKSNETLCFLHD